MLRILTADFVTGLRILEFPHVSLRWEIRIISSAQVEVTLTTRDPRIRRLNLRANAAVGKTLLGVFFDDFCITGGLIDEHQYDADAGTLVFTVVDIWELLRRRYVLPDTASTTSLLVESGDNAGQPNPATRTTFTGKSWPQIVRGLLEQSMSRPGGQLPIVFGPDGTGSHDKTYEGSAFKSVGDALTDLTQLDDGPEIQFVPRLRTDGLGFEWFVRVGDDAQRQLASVAVHRFDFSVQQPSVKSLKVKSSAKNLAVEAWATGGRQSAQALIARAYSPELVNAGYPRQETLSNANSTVVVQDTLTSYAQSALQEASRPLEWWTFDARIAKPPYLTEIGLGDFCDITVEGDAYLPDGKYRRRIVGMSGTEKNRWVSITTDEAMQNG